MTFKVCLIGPMGSGKSTLAKQLSGLCLIPYVDTDQLIVKQQNRSISDIFNTDGEPAFRKLERDCLEQQLNCSDPLIISTGGGIVTQSINRERLKLQLTVYLKASYNTLFERTQNDQNRPLLKGGSIETIKEIYCSRKPLYDSCASLTIDTEVLSLRQSAQILHTHLTKAHYL